MVHGPRRRGLVPGALLSRAPGAGLADDHEGSRAAAVSSPIAESGTDGGTDTGTHADTGTHPDEVFGVRYLLGMPLE